MANELPETALSFHVGDTLTLSWLWTKANRKDVRNLTDHAARVLFWYLDAAPHIARAAEVDPLNGLVIYDLLGDEYQLNRATYAQAQVYAPNWYVNGNAGQDGRITSCEVVKFIVRPKPV